MIVMRNCTENERAKLIGELYMPLPGQDIDPDDVQVGPWSDEAMGASFTAVSSAMAGKV